MKKPTLDAMQKALRANEEGKAVTADELQLVVGTGLLHDLWDAARKGTLETAVRNRATIRSLMGLNETTSAVPAQTGTATFNPDSFSLVVNYDAKLEYLARMGRYNFVNENFTSANFPTTRTGTATLEGGRLVHFGRDMSTAAVEKKLDEMGLRPGEPHELAAFGSKYPDVQREYPVVALGGKRWREPGFGECVAYLRVWDVRRGLYLDIVVSDWGGNDRFLAFPK